MLIPDGRVSGRMHHAIYTPDNHILSIKTSKFPGPGACGVHALHIQVAIQKLWLRYRCLRHFRPLFAKNGLFDFF